MPLIAILCGLILIAVGIVSGVQPELLGTLPEKDSPTKWIPAGFGGVLALCGLVSLAAPGMRKHMMHVAAMFALFGFLGGLAMPVVKLAKGTLEEGSAPFRAQMALTLVSLVFLWLCIRSFRAARKARQAAVVV